MQLLLSNIQTASQSDAIHVMDLVLVCSVAESFCLLSNYINSKDPVFMVRLPHYQTNEMMMK